MRAWLADLPADDVEELTFGMEADLAERAAEGDVRLGDLLGEPEEYAAELRSAAGLPPRTATVEGASSPGWFGELSAAVRTAGVDAVARWPWLRDLRPVWWVARGLVLGWALAVVLGTALWMLPVLSAAASFALGRALARPPRGTGVGVAVTLANVLAALLLFPSLVSALDEPADGPVDGWNPPGISLDGSQVSDLYVYDAAGNRVEGARILTEDGRGLFVDPGAVNGDDEVPLRPDGSADVATDVFPLVVGDRDPWAGSGTGWTPPLTLSPLPGAPAPTASGAASPSPSPSPSASMASSPVPTATPSVG
ncbi:hypothetical protein G7075_12050 [Phycicoccus sp. HDW14]|uniref:hypothetical protein n=1 Tax=Phycicoccus sp. HDW14 TaxID=2714941 RepID=UPI00140E2835|nr:hypothetical protein [Phycicoccus sp. HDW14]QIM21685.1 hypothetical protein G7075_12050 [Phycicoccus sp. HDW14]